MRPSSVRYGAKWCVYDPRHHTHSEPNWLRNYTLRTKMEINITTLGIIR